MSFTGHVANGVVVFDGPAPPDGTPVRVEPTANGTPVDNSDIDPDGVMSPRMIELVRQSRKENTVGRPRTGRWRNLMKHTLDLPEDASAQVDHYLYGTPKR